MKHLASLLLLSCLCLGANAQNVGNTAPDFTYPKLGGGEIRLADFSGKVVFVFLFGNTCPFCLAVGNDTEQQIQAQFGSNPNFQAIGLDMWTSSSTTASVTSFRARTGITYPLGLQAGGMASLYGTTYDRVLVIGADGVLRYKGMSNTSSTLQSARSMINTLLSAIGTGSDEIPEVDFGLTPAYPNPTAGETHIAFRIESTEHVRLTVFDMLGREVAVLSDGLRERGEHRVTWSPGPHLPPGLYAYSLTAGEERLTRTVLLTRR
ncbi:MAG: redoxin family protein [Rhodothermales bacterium]|nr:redoxin family protein [Rhodothermales bacterium]MBO6778107.1 redoxin family protein [Rhodothermales bacterium]